MKKLPEALPAVPAVPPVGLLSLSDDLLVHILRRAAPKPTESQLLHVVPLVCRRLAAVARLPSELWAEQLIALHRLQDGRRLANFVAWALPRAAGVRTLSARFTAKHQDTELQVLVGLFGSSLRMLDLMPGSHGPAPFQQATVNLLAYCTRLQCLQLCADALCSCDLSPLSALTDLRALALTSHNDKQRYAVPPSVLGLTRLRELALRATSLDTVQDGVSRLQALRTCVIVGARGLVIEPGFGTLRKLRDLEFNACSFGRLGSNSRQSSDGSDGGAGSAAQRVDARGDAPGAAGPAFFGASGIHGLDAAALGSAGGLHGRAGGAVLGSGGHGSAPRLGLAALRFLGGLGKSGAALLPLWLPNLAGLASLTSLTFRSPRGFGGAVPAVVVGLPALRRFVFVRAFREAALALPSGFARLGATLQQLTVEGVNWDVLPREVLALRQLRVLVVRSQSLARLTAGVAGLSLLRRLDLSANAKLEIDADVPLGALWELRSLDLSDCRKLNTAAPLVTAATLPRLRLVSLYGCTAGSRAAESALSELSYVLRKSRPDVRLVLAKADEVLVTGMEDDAELMSQTTLQPQPLYSTTSLPHNIAALNLGRPPLFPTRKGGST